MRSPKAWAGLMEAIKTDGLSPFISGMMREVVSKHLDDHDGIMLLTKEEFEAGMRESFLEGQRFAREHSLEGTLGRMGKEIGDATEAMKNTRLPQPIRWLPEWGPPPAPKDIPPRGVVIYHNPPRPMDRMTFDKIAKGPNFKKFAREMLRAHEQQMRKR